MHRTKRDVMSGQPILNGCRHNLTLATQLRPRPTKADYSAWGPHTKVTKIESTAISLAQPRCNYREPLHT
jgi:hypothetical protein